MQSAAGRLPSPQSRWRLKRRWDAAWGHAWAVLHRSGRAATCTPARTDRACVPTAWTGIGWRTRSMVEPLDLPVDLGRGLRLRSPVLVASGTFGYGFDAPQGDRAVLGAIVTKGTTLRPRDGNALRNAECDLIAESWCRSRGARLCPRLGIVESPRHRQRCGRCDRRVRRG